MSDTTDEGATAVTRGPRRSRALIITAVVVVVAIIAITMFAGVYTDALWYRSAGYSKVFTTMIWTKVGLFAVFGLLMAIAVALNVYLAFRFRPFFRPSSPEQSNLDRYRDVVTPLRTWIVVALAVVVGAFAGTSGMGHWRTYLLWRNAQSFHQSDPYFGKDIGFYVFSLPWWHFVVDFAMAAIVIALVAAMVVHYLYGGIRLQSPQDRLSGAAQVQLSVLLGLFVLVKGIDYYLDRFDLVNEKGHLFTGMDYTADNALLPAKNILIGVSLICALLFFLNVWRRTWQLPSVGLALLALSAILLGMIWPAVVQQFQVKPSEADKENSFIGRNIDATRQAYGLNTVDVKSYTPDNALGSSMRQLVDLATSNTPVLDPQVVQPAFEQIQQSKAYYSTAPVLDVDHYDIDGTERSLVLGAREVDQANIASESRNWSNLHTVYTHGNDLIAAYANGRNAQDQQPSSSSSTDPSSSIQFAQGVGATGNPQNDLKDSTGGYDDRIYYGQNSPDYSIVGKATPDSPDVELNLLTGGKEGTTQGTTTFTGPGDASVGSTFNQLMYALKFGDANILLSGRVNANSQILYDRDPVTRVEKAAPWLTVDSDPYPAVVDGRIEWILDGYTTTDRYPGSQRESLDTMTTDAQQVDNGLQPLATDEINYMRDAVKATVDAASGKVTLYAWDTSDPILAAWQSAFPGTVLDRTQMSPELLQHVRYPEDLFKVQRYQFARYHVTNATDWYQNNDRWAVPPDPYTTATFQAPYRFFASDPGVPGSSPFSLTSTYVPFGRTNLASYMTVDSDATSNDYGQIRVLDLPNNDPTPGPGQVANAFSSDPNVSSRLQRYKTTGVIVTTGNILTFPVGKGLLNVQPVYTSRPSTNASLPVLSLILVKYGDSVGVGPDLATALTKVFTTGTTTPPPGNGGQGGGNGAGNGGGGQRSIDAQITRTIGQLQAAFTAADRALAKGQLGAYAQQVRRAQGYLDHLVTLRASQKQTTSGSTKPGSPSASSSATPSTAPNATPSTAPSGSASAGAAAPTSPATP